MKTIPLCFRTMQAAIRAACLFLFTTWAGAQIIPPLPLDIRCPTNVTLWTCGDTAVWTSPLPVPSGGCSNYTVTCTPPVGAALPLGVHTVTCRVIDGCQNFDTCTFTITVRRDTEPPVIRCPSNIVERVCLNAAGGCGGIINYPPPTATDNSGTVAVSCIPPSGSFFPCGVHVVTCTAVDRCQNRDVCQFTITVEPGGQPPSIQCPPDQTILTCSNTAVLTYPPPVVVPAGTTVVCVPPPGAIRPLGSHAVTCTASNACGVVACSFKVEIRPVPPPSILCPSNMIVTAPCNSNCVPVTYSPIVANGTLVGCNPPSGTCLPLGIHTITCVATNVCGDRDVCQFRVRVVPGQGPPPQIICPNDLTVTTCSNPCQVVNYPAPTVNNGVLVKCNPPSGFCFPIGTTTVTCEASNACARAECTFTVTVRRVPPPSILCPTNDLVFTAPCNSNCVPVTYGLPPVLNGTLIGCNPPPGTCLPLGIHTITCVATNVCGDRDVCQFRVRVVQGNGQPPIIRCPPDITVVACSNDCEVVNYPAPVVIGGVLVKCDPPSGTCFPIGTTVVSCEASNICGRSECKFTVTVLRDPGRPKLDIKHEGRFVIICWPKTCRCYKLQSTRSFSVPIVWTDVQGAPEDHGDSWCVRLPIEPRYRFFRLIRCDQPTAPIFGVTGTGITRDQAGRLAGALHIPPGELHEQEGGLLFLDPRKFQAIPTKPIQDPAILDELRRNSQDDDGEMAFDAIDFGALRQLRVMDGQKAVDVWEHALREAGIDPGAGEPVARHTMFDAVDANGRPLAEDVQLDTHVIHQFDLGGIPLIGPGANLRVAFGPGGEPTAFQLAMRKLESLGEVPIISMDEAARRCGERYPQLRGAVRPRLIYYSPSLQLPAVQKILPCYECGGEAAAGGQQVSLIQTIIPAVDDLALVPAVQLEASANGSLVTAKATVVGGTPPYTYQWISSSADLSGLPPGAANIEYEATPRDDEKTETIRVIVTDANGLPAQASRTLEITGGGMGMLFTAAVGGVVDYGTERAVSDMGAANQSGFNSRMSGAGALRRFNWSGVGAWERDFKQGGTGLDHVYVDNVDLTFYIGHGYGGGFTFESNKDDDQIYYSDAVGDWGNGDLEWLALLSCQVLKHTWDSKSWYTRWIPDFDGLHIMLGFHTNAHDWDNFGYAFADWLHGRYGILPPVRVRDAWFLAKSQEQPASNIAVAIGVIGPGGCTDMNDYFHGRGPVGPDIRASQVQGGWRLSFQ